jgi:acyl-CoA thioester hydrolase
MSVEASKTTSPSTATWAPPSVIPVRWGDLDALNHVNNTVYFRYFEEARVQVFTRAEIYEGDTRGTVLAHTACDFIKPVLYPATVVIRQRLLRIGRSSLEVEAVLECEHEPGVVYARGRYIVVGASKLSGKSVPWTEHDIKQLERVFSGKE